MTHIRGLPPETKETLKIRAAARGWSVAELLTKLVTLHTVMQGRGDRGGNQGERDIQALLVTLGLEMRLT